MARILVIDDETNIRLMLKMALQKAGHTVGQAGDGFEGLDMYDDPAGWDLVLLDHRMPGMDGLEVLGKIRSRNPQARVIMITAFGTVDLAVDTMKAGATDFLRKPFSLDTLRGAVDSALAGVPGAALEPSLGATQFSFATVNGFNIESMRPPDHWKDGEIRQTLTVREPSGNTVSCEVVLPPYFVELVMAQTGCEEMPHGDLFWRGVCEEALANYLWQNAVIPPGGILRVEEYTTGLRRWVEQVLAASL